MKHKVSKKRVLKALDGTDPEFGRWIFYGLNVVIVLSVFILSVETLDDFYAKYRPALNFLEFSVIAIFGVEYVLRIWAAPNRLKYIFSFWGIVDFMAFVPSLFTHLSASTAFRALRLVRLLKLTRSSGAIDILSRALFRVRYEMAAMLVMGMITLYISAVGIYLFENEAQPDAFGSIPQSIWWAAVTLTTVGYGDVYPITVGGRVFTMVVLTLGLGVVAVPTALLSASLVSVIHDRDAVRQRLHRRKVNAKRRRKEEKSP